MLKPHHLQHGSFLWCCWEHLPGKLLWIFHSKLNFICQAFLTLSWHLPNKLSSFRRDLRTHSENAVLVKELFPAFRKPLASINSFRHKFIPSHFWVNCQIFLPLIFLRLLVSLDTKALLSKIVCLPQRPTNNILNIYNIKISILYIKLLNFNFYNLFLYFSLPI